MPSDKQLQANRQNARRSTSPRTPQVKARASLNAVSHGLETTAQRQEAGKPVPPPRYRPIIYQIAR